MRTLADDIVLLAIRPDGRLSVAAKLRFAVAGSELVQLAVERRVDVVDNHIQVIDPAPTGDELLDKAFAHIQSAKRPRQPKTWVAIHRPRTATSYLNRLVEHGVIRVDHAKKLGIFTATRWTILDTARAAEARARIDEAARSTGPIEPLQSALGGLVQAIGLDAVLYPAKANEQNKAARARLKQIAKRDAAAKAVHSAAEQAAVDASIDAAVDASIHAAVSASVSAAHHAAHDGGASTGHH